MARISALPWHADLEGLTLAAIKDLPPKWRAALLSDATPHESQTELFRDAGYLNRSGFEENQVRGFLRAKWSGYERGISDRELERAIERTRPGVLAARSGPSYPPLNPETRARALAGTRGDLAALKRESQVQDPGAVETGSIINGLFGSDNPLLCFASEKNKPTTERRRAFAGAEADYQFLVANPMSAEFGETQEGRMSPRSNNNVGPQRYQVIEFDSGTLDEQARLHLHLRSLGVPLVLVVFSGGKSLHGWYVVDGLSAPDRSKFLHYCAALGADRATFVPCQLVRMPNGFRWTDGGADVKQEVVYLDLEVRK
jgi:hypothetical protein